MWGYNIISINLLVFIINLPNSFSCLATFSLLFIFHPYNFNEINILHLKMPPKARLMKISREIIANIHIEEI